jgi:tight adherence protein B
MGFVLLTFGISLALIMGAYWLLVLRPEAREKAAAVGRVGNRGAEAVLQSIVNAPDRLSSIPALDRFLGRARMAGALQRLLVESGLNLTVGAFVLSSVLGAAVGLVVGWSVLEFTVAAVVLALLGAIAPYAYVRHKRTVRLRVFEEQFPEAIDLISRALRAGHALTTGLGMVADEIPAPVGAEFKRLYDEQNFGMSLPDALRAMAERVPVLDAKFFVTAVLTQRESGGNLSEVLDNLASVMRERFKLKRQIRVISAHGRISGWVLSCLPPALAAILFVLSPNFMRILWEDPLGLRLVMVAVTLQLIGTYAISRLVKIEY